LKAGFATSPDVRINAPICPDHALPGTSGSGVAEVVEAISDDTQALLTVNSKVKFGPDAPEMDARSARMYVLNDDGKIKIEHVVFFLS